MWEPKKYDLLLNIKLILRCNITTVWSCIVGCRGMLQLGGLVPVPVTVGPTKVFYLGPRDHLPYDDLLITGYLSGV